MYISSVPLVLSLQQTKTCLDRPHVSLKLWPSILSQRRSQWPRGLRRRSAAARLLRSWVRIPPGAWKFVWCECCVLSGRDLCDELITRTEESYRLWCVVVCDLETSRMRRPWPALGRSATGGNTQSVLLWIACFACEICFLNACNFIYLHYTSTIVDNQSNNNPWI